ncbi:MAG TPA: AI-2E family transporter [Chitinophagales bacterium]|nr:AI-2E family transporter [Chitinophagales bacterium]
MTYPKLFKAAAILAVLIFSVIILVYAKPFLVPLTFGALLAMLLLPIAKWLRKKGMNEAMAALLSILVLVAFFALVGVFVGWQVSELAGNATQVEQQITEKYHQASAYVAEQLDIPKEQQQRMIDEQQK